MIYKMGIMVLGLLCIGGAYVYAADNFGFGKDDSVKAVKDVNITGTDGSAIQRNDALLGIVRGAINWTLGILGLIAVILIMYGGLRMVIAAGDADSFNQGFTIMRSAAIGLVIIGIAWFIVSIGFWLTNLLGGAAEGTTAGTDT